MTDATDRTTPHLVADRATAPLAPATPRDTSRRRIDWYAVRAVIAKDMTAVRRSKPIVLPMILVPVLLLVIMPTIIGLFARSAGEVDIADALGSFSGRMLEPIADKPPDEQILILVLGFLMAPLFLIVPLMVSSVIAADAFAGEKERRTIEAMLNLPISDRDLFIAKILGAFIPSMIISWVGFLCYAIIANALAWPIMERIFVPTSLWLVMIFWVGPAVATLGLGVMVRVSARARTTQEATQLGGAVILPLIFLALGQSTGLLLVDLPIALGIGAFIWVVALALVARGARKFTRDTLAARA
jgi:ABC-type Na+ efflux pump permease subunit